MSQIIKSTTKRGQSLLRMAAYNQGEELSDVYDSYSTAKAEAYKDCKTWYEEDKGTGFRIISHCRNNFSVAWELEFGGRPATRIETYASSYIIVKEE